MNLLSNKWVVIALCGAAVGIVCFNLAPMLGSGSASHDGYYDDDLEDDWLSSERELEGARLDLKSVDSSALEWNSSPRRDPFARSAPSSANLAATWQVAADAAVPAGPALPRLEVLAVGATSELAVLNGKVVMEGEWIDEFSVSEISEQGVLLTRKDADSVFLRAGDSQ